MFLKQVHKGSIEFHHFLFTVVLAIGGYILGQIPLTIVALSYMDSPRVDSASTDEFLESMDFSFIGMDENLTFFLLLIMFIVAAFGLYIGVTRLHKRSFKSIFTARKKIHWGRILFAFGLWMILSLLVEAIGYAQAPDNYTWQFEPRSFFILLILVILFLPIQTTFEEIFIRGYLMQAVGLLSKQRWVPVVITSLIFGAMHFMNPEVGKYGWVTMMSYYVGIAIFLAIMTLLDDGLELAIGVHAATNMYGAVFATFEDSAIQTPALFQLAEVDPSAMAGYSLGAAVLFFYIVQRKYGLTKFWKITGSTDRVDPELKNELNLDKQLIYSNIGYDDISDLDTDDGIKILGVDENPMLVASTDLAPFIGANNEVQKKNQLGFFEVVLPLSRMAGETQAKKLANATNWISEIGKLCASTSLLINKRYTWTDDQGLVHKFAISKAFDTATSLIDGWPISLVLVIPLTDLEDEIATSQGVPVLIHTLKEDPGFPHTF